MPTLSGTKILPAATAASAMSANRAGGRHSTDDVAACCQAASGHDRHGDPPRGEPGLGLALVTRRDCREGKARDAGGERRRDDAADGAEPGDADRKAAVRLGRTFPRFERAR